MKPAFQPELLSLYTAQVAPLLFLLAVSLILMLMDAFRATKALPWATGLGFIGSAALAFLQGAQPSATAFGGMIETGGVAPFIHAGLCLSGLFALFFTGDYLRRYDRHIPDIHALLAFAVLGMSMLANARDMIMVFIGLETMSICLYVFAAAFKSDVTSNESGLKYFLLGAFASGFLLFGISLLYGLTGTTNFTEFGAAAAASAIAGNPSIFLTAVALLLVGFLFKLAAFPFHNWAPDVYEGSPTPLAGFMATASKMATFVALANASAALSLASYPKFVTLIAAIAVLTMVYSNIVAARQTNLKRMLAYSGIAHSGYILLAICAGPAGYASVIFYTIVYTITTIGAFGMISMVESSHDDTNLDAWRGLGAKAPVFAGAMSVFLFSMAGIPPLAGFMSKYQVFLAAINAGYTTVAIIGILSSVIGAYYYLRVIVQMFFVSDEAAPGKKSLPIDFGLASKVGVALLVLLVVLLGVLPSLVTAPIDAFILAAK